MEEIPEKTNVSIISIDDAHQSDENFSIDLIYSESFHRLSKLIPKTTECKIQLKVTVLVAANDIYSDTFHNIVCEHLLEKIIENGSFI